jgi:DNA-binding XRE family transcriptional regulator
VSSWRAIAAIPSQAALIVKARMALGLTQAEFGKLVSVAARTIMRWEAGGVYATPEDWATLATSVFPKDETLAAALAAAGGTTLAALGLVASGPAREARKAHLVDSIVCAAAEAMAAPPQAVRPSVLAAFDRAAALGLAIEDVRTTLAHAKPKPRG